MVRFRYNGPQPTVFTAGGVGEVGPGQEFEVPDELAVSFSLHGHCECLEPDKLAALVDALPEDRAEGIREKKPQRPADAAPAAAATRRPGKKSDSDDPAATAK